MDGLSEDDKRMKIFHADPLDYHSIMEALKGCYGLFYTYEPPQDQITYDEYMVEVEVRAAHNVLEACAQTETIDKVVFTSTATSTFWRDDHPYLEAAQMYEDGIFVTVDINFLVDSHICVYEDISSYGRYLCFNCVVNRPEDAFKLDSMLTPSAPSLPLNAIMIRRRGSHNRG